MILLGGRGAQVLQEIASDPETRKTQLDQNPGLWLRVHPNVRSLILPNVLEH